jgi:hypothetical protein
MLSYSEFVETAVVNLVDDQPPVASSPVEAQLASDIVCRTAE